MSETFTVRELCSAVEAVVAATFPDEVWVKGSISSLSRSANGHVFFDLVDPDDSLGPGEGTGSGPGSASTGVLPVALFASNRTRVNHILRKSGSIRMDDGIEIRIKGQLAFYPPQSRVQLVMSLIDPAYTVGQIALARQVLLDRLAGEGLLNANGALSWPALPLKVGLVTSDGSAAHADFMHELELSGYAFDITLFDSRVQGVDAVPSLVEGIGRAAEAAVDIVVVIRGGGARTDLVAFDAEAVARAIATCPCPVLVGVGHEVDRSVADEVANTSAKTPTAAANAIVETVRRFDDDVERAAARLVEIAGRRLDREAADLASDGNRLVVAANGLLIGHVNRLDHQLVSVRRGAERVLERAEANLDQASAELRALDPARVLARGWTITHTSDGTLVRDTTGIEAGMTLVTTTGSGTLTSTVTDTAAAETPDEDS